MIKDILRLLPIEPLILNEKIYYTGVGFREISADVLVLMARTAEILAKLGYILRSGGAKGSDKAFEAGCDSIDRKMKEICRPKDTTQNAIAIAEKYHGAWFLCSDYAKLLHGRNVYQVLGKDLKTPSKFVICYTHDMCLTHKDRTVSTGGTGTAISVAEQNGIPIINLSIEEHYNQVKSWIKYFSCWF